MDRGGQKTVRGIYYHMKGTQEALCLCHIYIIKDLKGLARYSVHLTATALEKILCHFLYMLDPHH